MSLSGVHSPLRWQSLARHCKLKKAEADCAWLLEPLLHIFESLKTEHLTHVSHKHQYKKSSSSPAAEVITAGHQQKVALESTHRCDY